MKKIFRTIYSLALTLLISFGVIPVARAASLDPVAPTIMISELQTEGPAGKYEFIELYNSGPTRALNGWRLEYLSAAHAGGSDPTRVLAAVKGEFLSNSFILISQQEYHPDADVLFASGTNLLARSGGHIRLVDDQNYVVDQLSWGSATMQGQWPKVPEITPGTSVQRILPGEPLFTTGFTYQSAMNSSITPTGGGFQVASEEPPACQALQLTEILPNARGADEGQEFIELYNPTSEVVPLKDCWLRLGNAGTRFVLPDESILPGAYRMFTDSQTGLKLPNATAQPVWLLFGDASFEGKEYTYADTMPEGVAWAIFGESWQMTYTPTPAAKNVLTGRPVEDQVLETEPLPCPAGKERHVETNRCRNVPQEDIRLACQDGQERSSVTGRCRAVASSIASGACKDGQERNLETNRCRSVLAASVSKMCPEGQERNHQTNRCRRIQAATQLAAVHDIGSSNLHPKYWWLGGLTVLIIGGYAVYEWRHDLVFTCQRWRACRSSGRSAINSRFRGSGDKERKSVL